MCTLVFNCNLYGNEVSNSRIEIYHSDKTEVRVNKFLEYKQENGKTRYHTDCMDNKWGTKLLPDYEELKREGITYLPREGYKLTVVDEESGRRYLPLFISGSLYDCFYKNYEMFGCENSQELVCKTLGVETFATYAEFAKKTGLNRFVIKRNVDLYIKTTKQNVWHHTDSKWESLWDSSILTVGEPIKVIRQWNWKDRWQNIFKRVNCTDPTKYKKVFDIETFEGENGFALVGYFGDFSDFYPERICDEDYIAGKPIKLSTPSKYTPKEIEEIQAKEEANRKYWEQREKQKSLPGYCDHCGEPNAQYVNNPFGESGWFCRDCYNDHYSDSCW